VVKLETIDPQPHDLRLHLDDLGWSEDDWNLILGRLPYGAKPDTRLFDFIKQATEQRAARIVRGDWLAFTPPSRPLYDKLLKLPGRLRGPAEGAQRVDVEENIKRFSAPAGRASRSRACRRTTA
jgi:hypothetical protein